MLAPWVDAAWLSAHPDVVVADVRYYLDGRSGAAAHAAGHVPGAVHVDLDACLAGPASVEAGLHPMPSPADFAAAMSGLGIGDDDVVVAYDDEKGVMAARLVWMLRVTGHEAALLDGGWEGWSGPRETGPVTRPPAVFTARAWPQDRLADPDELLGATVLDARPGPRFRGEVEPRDARPGHIPGARSVPCRDNVGSDGRLLDRSLLRERLTAAGVPADGDWVSSCGSGVTACHTLLLAEELGLAPGRLYAGSWSQWAATDRPAETGP